MMIILDRTDIEVSDIVRLYNQALLRYNGMTKTRANKPMRVVVVREEKVVKKMRRKKTTVLAKSWLQCLNRCR